MLFTLCLGAGFHHPLFRWVEPPTPAFSSTPALGIIVPVMSRRNGSAALDRLLDPVSRSLNVEAARKLVRLKADAKTQARVDALARKSNEGELTPAERSEYEQYVRAGHLIAILQAKARLLLAKNA